MVVTGIGAFVGPVTDAASLWAALMQDPPPETFQKVSGFEPRDWFDRRQAQRTGRFSQLAVAAALTARADADDPVDVAEAVGVVMGSSQGDVPGLLTAAEAFRTGGRRAMAVNFGVITMTNAGSANTAFSLGAKGSTSSISSGCASGTHAVIEAYRLVKSGQADVAYGGGSEASMTTGDPDTDLTAAGLANLRVLTAEKVARPFDLGRSGFVFAEGAAVLRLELLDHARERGVRQYAEVLGGANTVDGHDLVHPAPRGTGVQRAMRLALREAGATPGDVGHVNCHGTGTRANDQAESDAVVDVFGRPGPPVTATKAVTGHPGAASGALEAAILALSVHHRLIPPTRWSVEPDPAIEADVVRGAPRPWSPGIGLSTSVGLGGQNGVLAMGPPPPD